MGELVQDSGACSHQHDGDAVSLNVQLTSVSIKLTSPPAVALIIFAAPARGRATIISIWHTSLLGRVIQQILRRSCGPER